MVAAEDATRTLPRIEALFRTEIENARLRIRSALAQAAAQGL